MGRLTMTSDKGGVAFTFDLDITCRPSEAQKILKLAQKLKEYEDAEEQGLLLRLPAPLDDVESFKIADKGIWLKVPCQIGDTVYVICECETIPPQLDGTLYGENGEPGTATGYYCPYEENCPHVGKACEDDFDCDKFKGKPAVFEDSVIAVWHDESGVSIITSNCPINSRLGEYVFFKREEAEAGTCKNGEREWVKCMNAYLLLTLTKLMKMDL